MIITIEELIVGDEPDAWRSAGFTVDGDICRLADVRVRLVGESHGRRILGWTLAGIDPAGLDTPSGGTSGGAAQIGVLPGTSLDGLPTGVATRADDAFGGGDGTDGPVEHPNGVLGLDHIVILTPDDDRTRSALEAVGLEVRRVRETDQYGAAMLQTFFRAGPVIVELVGPVTPLGDGEPGFFGLAMLVNDIDATAELLSPAIGDVKDAVQDGRRVATLRHRDLGMSVATAFMSI